MSSETAISMRELEAETAELLPSRETLNCWRSHSGSSSVFVQSGNGDTAQSGVLNLSFLNGNLDDNSILSGNTIL